MKQEIFDAAEARRMTSKANYDDLAHDMVIKCMKQIEEVASCGYDITDVNIRTRQIRELVAKELRALGYQVEQVWFGLCISWRENS